MPEKENQNKEADNNDGSQKGDQGSSQKDDQGSDSGGLSMEELQKQNKSLMHENAERRVENKKLAKGLDDLKTGLGKALGLEKDEDSSEGTTKKVEKLIGDLKKERVINQFTSVASKLGANTQLTLSVLKGDGSLSDLDPDSSTFIKELTDIVKVTLKSNPELKAATQVKKQGVDFSKGADGKVDMNALIRRKAGR